MAWTDLAFSYGSVLTSSKMTQMFDNFAYGAGSTVPTFPDGAAAATKAAGTNTAAIATTAYVDSGVTAGTKYSEKVSRTGNVGGSSVYAEFHNARVVKGGTYRVELDLLSGTGGLVYARIYKNGAAFGTVQSTTTSLIVTEDLAFAAGDTVQIYAMVTAAPSSHTIGLRLGAAVCPHMEMNLTLGVR